MEGERILSAGSRLSVPAGARVIDLGSATILPGLIDAHTHLLLNEDMKLGLARLDIINPLLRLGTARRSLRGAAIARDYLASGFTTVRDLGNGGSGGDLALRDAIKEGWVPGPTMLVAGRALSGLRGQFPLLPEGQPTLVNQEYAPVEDPSSAIRAVRHAVADGGDVVKVILDQTFAKEDLAAIVAEAHRLKQRVAAHATSAYEVLLAAECGVDSIEHGTQGVPDEALKVMAAKKIAFVPTAMSRELAQRLYVEGLELTGEAARAAETENQAWLKDMRDVILRARKAGILIALGSDLYHQVPRMTRGEGALECLFGLAEAGLTPIEALRAATSSAAEVLGRRDSIGQIKPGFAANLVAVAGNPLENLRVMGRIKMVIKQGIVVTTENIEHPLSSAMQN
jgi:imidazolonepropionase-like amidohydrolase